MESLMVSSRDTYNVGKVVYVVVNGEIIVRLPGFSAAIYRKRVQ